MQQAGARLAITYQNERLKQEAEEMIAALPNAEGFQCDVSSDDEIAHLFDELKDEIRQNRRPRPLHRLRACRGAEERLRPDAARGLPHRTRYQRLLAGGPGPRRRAAHDRRRQHHHAHLLRRQARRAQLQRDGRGQGRAGMLPSATWRTTSASSIFASTPSPPGPSRRWPRAASATSATC